MRVSTVVIGANYGDEGKGLITDFETRRVNAGLVVRFNGGAQAGHTVTTESARHVFGHIGAGTFAGADTWLGSKFIVNPAVLEKELKTLDQRMPRISIHPQARITTLYDMALNSLVELQRGVNRHGSCGLGINETVTRHDFYPLTFETVTTRSRSDLVLELHDIRTRWVPARLQALGITEIPEPYKSILEDDNANEMATSMSILHYMSRKTRLYVPTVFEGAQGLGLDEFLGEFPYVTRSITGLPYAIVAARDLHIDTLQPVYVTRAYLTRHGAGPLEEEGYELSAKIKDETNIHNPWQGAIRYAPLNLPMLARYIAADQTRAIYIAQAHGTHLMTPTIALTCLDQMADKIPFIDLDGELMSTQKDSLVTLLETRLGYKVSHISRGPKATDVEFLNFGV